jgi:hypothetical protein
LQVNGGFFNKLLVGDGAHRIKGRPLFEMEDLWNDPACQKSESHKDANEYDQTPTGAQAPRVEEKFPHVIGTLARYSFFDLKAAQKLANWSFMLTGVTRSWA